MRMKIIITALSVAAVFIIMVVQSACGPVPPGPGAQDGRSILTEHCGQCHETQWIEQNQKTRSNWEKTLTQMEAKGAQLDAGEKAILLNYLTRTDQP
jgi:hypothetical protein